MSGCGRVPQFQPYPFIIAILQIDLLDPSIRVIARFPDQVARLQGDMLAFLARVLVGVLAQLHEQDAARV